MNLCEAMPRRLFQCTWGVVVFWGVGNAIWAQQPPSIGYMFPPGGQAGETIDVVLGGYDWTPDMQLFVHDPRIQLESLAPPGPILVPEPPYWFGAKSRRPPFALPREMPARLTIPSDIAPGVIRWQAANANGATATGRFLVLAKAASEAALASDEPRSAPLLEVSNREGPQQLPSLPVVVSGQILKIEEVDRYRFTLDRTGPVTCAIASRSLGSSLNAVLEIRDEGGRMVADAADTAGSDVELTFVAEAGHQYEASVYDLDFRGDPSLVYWLSILAGPRVVAAVPAAARRGETREVELIGYGVASGEAKLESVIRQIEFPGDPDASSFAYQLDTSHGAAPPFTLLISDLPESVEPTDASADSRHLALPIALTGILDERFSEDRYRLVGREGDVWKIDLLAERIGSPLDVAVAVLDSDGTELARADDVPIATDAALEFTVPADGDYQISVTDVSGHSGRGDAVYRMTVQRAEAGFTLAVPELLNVPIGGKIQCKVDATRAAGFASEIAISVAGLPPGVTVPEDLTIPAGQTTLNIELAVAADAPATAAVVSVSGQANIDAQDVRRTAGPLLVATTIEPPFAIDAEGKDDVTKWPRGTTFPAPVLIERDADFDGEIVLEMTSQQGRHRQGIRGPELTVPEGVERILYPIFLPEWLETTRTSRMVVNGVARVADPQGTPRYSVSRQKTRMGFLPTGALLKLSAETTELQALPGQPFVVPVAISRSPQLTEPVLLELRRNDSTAEAFTATPLTLTADQDRAELAVTCLSTLPAGGEYPLTLRATAMQQGTLPVVSETRVVVQVADAR